jgi:superfamily II DNA or RNA helicase
MKLRKWQKECVNKALSHYKYTNKHFLCLATPGSGKTIMAAEVAFQLYEQDKIDFVLCFSPSTIVSENIKRTFLKKFSLRFDGVIGAVGCSYTYQSILFLKPDFWQLLDKSRVLVVFDEIHHCSGTSSENSNAWGQEIIQNIQHQAAYTLALTGTPWRSDKSPIVLSNYANLDNKIICDYSYGLKDAVNDGVCRNPKLVLIDNEKISFTDDENVSETFTSLKDLLKESKVSYSSIITNYDAILHILTRGVKKLSCIRNVTPNAGGLVVASSVMHAKIIFDVLRKDLNQSAALVTYKQVKPSEIIENFRYSNTQWIVSVGMVSEGTDIPRLQVCCHLSHVKTELYFRQVLGRILRVNHQRNQDAWLYTFAEPKLSDFANRIDIELPNAEVCFREYLPDNITSEINQVEGAIVDFNPDTANSPSDVVLNFEPAKEKNGTVISYNFEILGSYREQVIATFNSPF